MESFIANPPMVRFVRKEIMCANPNHPRIRLNADSSPQAGLYRPPRNKIPLPLLPSAIIFSFELLNTLPERCERGNVDPTFIGWTVPKLKLISQFADMGKDRAQSVSQEYFCQSPKHLKFVARRGHAR